MDKQPLVSFYLPVYKKDPEIFRDCLNSLFSQSLKEIEVICVFDGEDETLQAVAKEFPKAVSVVVEHGGAPKARNAGLAMCSGKYVAAWDADCRIKPDAAKRWIQEFDSDQTIDFVYTGYELTKEQGSFESESFDRYSLECGNFICSMSPVKREKAPRWDEDLDSAQDWDYWLTATEQGLKGAFIEGSAFITPAPDPDSISIKGLSGPKHDDIVAAIRAKHGVPEREIGVFSTFYRDMGLKIAKILDADWIKPQGYTPTRYKTIFNFGYGWMSRFDGIAGDVTKIQYWLPGEIEGLSTRSYSIVKEVITNSKKVVNLCGTQYEKNKLEDFGIDAEIVVLPLSKDDYSKISHDLPEEFTILVATDKSYATLLKDLSIDLPHVKFKFNAAKTSEYSCFLSFYQFAALDYAMLNALVNGRHVISNVTAPFTGFVDPDQTWEKFKAELYEKIRIVRGKPFNKEAQDYYLQLTNPKVFVEKICSYRKPALEIV